MNISLILTKKCFKKRACFPERAYYRERAYFSVFTVFISLNIAVLIVKEVRNGFNFLIYNVTIAKVLKIFFNSLKIAI